MPYPEKSYEFSHNARSVSEVARDLLARDTNVLSFLSIETGRFATNTKHEWRSRTFAPIRDTLTVAHVAASGIIEVGNTAKYVVGSILRFTINPTAAASTSTLTARITGITNATTLAIAVFGGSTDENLGVGTQIDVISNPRGEGESYQSEGVQEGELLYNYTHNIISTRGVAGTTLATYNYGIGRDPMEDVAMQAIIGANQQIAGQAINGIRTLRNSSNPGTMGGLATLGTQVSSAGAITENKIHSAFTIIRSNGGNGNVVLANPRYAGAFAAMLGNRISYNTNVPTGAVGANTTTFVSTLGDVASIVYAEQMPYDKIIVTNRDDNKVVFMQGRDLQLLPEVQLNADRRELTVRGECTLEMDPRTTIVLNGITLT